jgi:DNA-binding winged helix-turn-helix (wHTH) protein
MWLDLGDERLWCGTQAITLRPKAFALLRYLVEHAEQLLAKDTLLEAIWPETTVSEVVLAVCIRELRRALGDDPKAPRFIETVHRRGYRFIGTIPIKPASQERRSADTARTTGPMQTSRVLLVGRDLELHHLHRCLDESLSSRRQFLFVTGEAGLGKTTLVDTFLEAINADGSLWIGHGQCLEHYGAGEAYMPVLEALGRLCRGADGQDIVALLAQHAPTWLVHLPGLLSPAGYAALQQQVFSATQGRMLREMAETLERLTARRPLVLVLEDLHWSDYATLDLLAALAKRREPARLLLVATYRPPDVLQRGHPLRQMQHDLRMQRTPTCAFRRARGPTRSTKPTRASGTPRRARWSGASARRRRSAASAPLVMLVHSSATSTARC